MLDKTTAMTPLTNVTGNYGTSAANVTDDTTYESFQSFVEYDVSRWLLLLYRPVCCMVGMVGNALCVTVLTSSSLRHSPTAVYMVTLSLLDLVISFYAGLDLLLKELGEVGVREFFFVD
jgi:hypothetical protein